MRNIAYLLINLLLIACTDFPPPAPAPSLSPEEQAEAWKDKAGSKMYASPQWLAALDSAIFYNPQDAEPYYRKAVSYIRRGVYIEGIAYLDKAVALDPASYINYRGWVRLVEMRDYEGAARDFEKAIELKSTYDSVISGHAWLRLALARKQLRDYDGAWEAFEEYFENVGQRHADVYAFIHRGVLSLDFKLYDKAMTDFDEALRRWERCPEAYYYKALIYQQQGKRQQACKAVQQALLHTDLIHANPSREYIDQVYVHDFEILFDQTCRGS